jgi:hypothetical protein
VTTKPTKPKTNGQHAPGSGKHTGPIRSGEGHNEMTSYCGWLLKKHPEIELDDYIGRCRQRWEQFDQSKFIWTWAECEANPVLDCWERFERGEVLNDGGVGGLNLPPEFWESRPMLRHIRQAAHSRGRSADAVLYTTLARVSAMVSPRLTFENCLGEGSLNLFVAIIGKSGRGKSAAVRIAKTILHTGAGLTSKTFRDSMGIGSGEGLAELYMGMEEYDTGAVYGPKAIKAGQPVLKERRAKVRDNAFVYVDEGQTLNGMNKRQGNIVLPVIRTAWTGDSLGQANAREETTRSVPAGSYSLGMVIGYQKDSAQDLFEGTGLGTPQRFIFCSATDPHVPVQPPDHPGYMDDQSTRVGRITFATNINRELWMGNHGKVTGQQEDDADLDSHEPLMLSKLSALLCILEGRTEVTPKDWSAAKTMYEISRNVADDLIEYGQEKAQDKQDAYADQFANREVKALIAKTNANEKVHRIGLLIYKHAVDGPVQTVGWHRKQLHRRDKPLFHEALDYTVQEKWLSVVDGKVSTSIAAPPSS